MGSGIAEVAAVSGCNVAVVEVNETAVELGQNRVQKSLERALGAEKIDQEIFERAMSAISFSDDLNSLADREFVIEAVVEDEQTKVDVFNQLAKVLEDPNAVMASNTSAIPIMKLAMATERPSQVVGMHFFNPVPVMGLVEIISSLLTSEETATRCREFTSEQMGKRVINSQDRAGFVVNALLIPFILSAIRMLESGFATAEDIDTGMMVGCNHPMGPLALCDLIGLDTTLAVADSLYEEFREQLYAPPPMLNRLCDAGLLGRKTGRGFYTYS